MFTVDKLLLIGKYFKSLKLGRESNPGLRLPGVVLSFWATRPRANQLFSDSFWTVANKIHETRMTEIVPSGPFRYILWPGQNRASGPF